MKELTDRMRKLTERLEQKVMKKSHDILIRLEPKNRRIKKLKFRRYESLSKTPYKPVLTEAEKKKPGNNACKVHFKIFKEILKNYT